MAVKRMNILRILAHVSSVRINWFSDRPRSRTIMFFPPVQLHQRLHGLQNQPVVVAAQIESRNPCGHERVLLPGRALRCGAQRSVHRGFPASGMRGLTASGRFVLPRADLRPRCQVRRARNTLMSTPISGMTTSGDLPESPGIVEILVLFRRLCWGHVYWDLFI